MHYQRASADCNLLVDDLEDSDQGVSYWRIYKAGSIPLPSSSKRPVQSLTYDMKNFYMTNEIFIPSTLASPFTFSPIPVLFNFITYNCDLCQEENSFHLL